MSQVPPSNVSLNDVFYYSSATQYTEYPHGELTASESSAVKLSAHQALWKCSPMAQVGFFFFNVA